MDPTFSIILPTWNGAAHLAAAIDGVLGQTFRDFRLLVLDNASTDATPQLMAGYTDERIIYIRNEANLGMVGNINKGLSMARGRLGVILCADDYWHPEFLERSLKMQNDAPGMSFTNSMVIDEGGIAEHPNVFRGKTRVSGLNLVRHMQGIPLSSLVFPLQGSTPQFDARLPFNCDLEFVLRRVVIDKIPLTYIDWPGVFVKLHAANETKRYNVVAENGKLLNVAMRYTPMFSMLRFFILMKKARLLVV